MENFKEKALITVIFAATSALTIEVCDLVIRGISNKIKERKAKKNTEVETN